MIDNNILVREALIKSGMRLWELADLLGVADATLTRKLRHELPEETQAKLVKIIKRGGLDDGERLQL